MKHKKKNPGTGTKQSRYYHRNKHKPEFKKKEAARKRKQRAKKAEEAMWEAPASNDSRELYRWAKEVLTIPPGHPRSGLPLKLPLYARKWFRKALAPGIKEAALSVARKQAKSTIISVYLLSRISPNSPFARLGYAAGVVSITAIKAGELWNQMRALAIYANDPAIKEYVTFLKSGPRRIESPLGKVEFLSADRASGHASSYHDSIIDELGLLSERHRGLVTGMGDAVLATSGRVLYVGTYGDGPFFPELEARESKKVYVKIYRAMDDKCALDDKKQIKKANPGIRDGVVKMADVLHKAEKGATSTEDEADYRTWNLNMAGFGGSETLLSISDFNLMLTDELPQPEGAYVLGVDRGEGDSLTAAVSYWPVSGRMEYRAIIGARISIEDRSKRDNVKYREAVAAGECLLDADNNVPDFSEFIKGCTESWGMPRKVCLDGYRKADTEEVLKNVGFGASQINFVPSGPKGQDPCIKSTRRLVRLGRVKCGKPSILLQANIAATLITRTIHGNIILNKLGTHRRIDICSAMVLAVGIADQLPAQPVLKVY